jgi:hypothetical protein
MSDGPSVHAVGRDFSRYLPGLFSVNYFGERYVELIGREVLLHAPSERADTLGSGVIVVLDSTIGSHPVDTVVSGSAEADALDAIGRRHFFQKN